MFDKCSKGFVLVYTVEYEYIALRIFWLAVIERRAGIRRFQDPRGPQ